jgi:IclR family transcriptional regulator, acetate operon repressor
MAIGSTESIALRAFALLEYVVNAPGPVTLDDATLALALPKPTVYRILGMLKDADLLRRETATKRYTLGPRLTAFAVNLWRSDMLRLQWHRALEDAVAQIGESCNLTLLENNQVLYLDRVETSHPLRLHLETGTRVPLHCTASGKLFLSQLSPEQARRLLGKEPYARFTAKTIVKFDALEAELAKIRKTGIGTHDCERFDDSVAIAVPVLTRDGAAFAAVAMHAPSTRASIKTCLRSVPVLQRAAAQIAATFPAPGAQALRPAAPAPVARRARPLKSL